MTENVAAATVADAPAPPASTSRVTLKTQQQGLFWGALAYALLLPAFMFATTPVTFLGKSSGWLDPFIYTSLIHDYGNLLDRFGGTYYAARIGHIFPGAFFDHLLGPVWGYFAYHYLVLAFGSVVAFLFGSRTYSVKVGLLASTIVCLTPWLVFSLLSDHYDGVSGTYMLAAMMFAFWPSKRQIAVHIAAGLLLSVATNINQFCFFLFGLILPSWIWFHHKRKPLHLVAMGIAGMAAFGLGTLLLGLWLRASHPAWGASTATSDIITYMVSGGAKNWFMPFSEQVWRGYYYPFVGWAFSPILCVWLMKGRADRPANSLALPAIIFHSIILLFFLALQFIFHTGFLAQHFYTIYVFAPTLILAVAIFGEAERRVSPRTATIIIGSAILLLLALHFVTTYPMLVVFHQLGALGSIALGLAVLAVFTTMVFMRSKTAAAAIAVVATTIGFYWPYHSWPHQMMRNRDSTGWDIRLGATFLVDTVQRLSPPKEGPVGFWYAAGNQNLDSVQSAFLWAFSARIVPPEEQTGMPVITEKSMPNILKFTRIMLLADSPAEIDRGVAALKAFFAPSKTAVEVKEQGAFEGKTYRYNYAFVVRDYVDEKANEFQAKDLVFAPALTEGKSLSAAASYTDTKDGFKLLKTDPANGGYSLSFPLPSAAKGIRVRLRVNVEKGALSSVIVKAADSNAWVTAEANTQLGRDVVDFEVKPTGEPLAILLRNGAGGGPSEIVIEKVEVYELTPNTPDAAGAAPPADAGKTLPAPAALATPPAPATSPALKPAVPKTPAPKTPTAPSDTTVPVTPKPPSP